MGTLSDVPRAVLIIEDDSRIRRIVPMTLQREGLQVTRAAGGDEGLERLGERDFDVMLLDVMLPAKDGFEVCQEIRRTSTTPVLMVTAMTDARDRVRSAIEDSRP